MSAVLSQPNKTPGSYNIFPLTADNFCYLQARGMSARSRKEQRYPAGQFQFSVRYYQPC